MGTVKANAFCVSITYLSSFKRYILLLVTPLKYPVYYRSDIRIRRFRPHVARSVTIRRHRTCYVYMVIHGRTWSYMVVHGRILSYMVVHGRTWSYMVVHATCTWSYMPRVHCRTWSYMVVHATCTWSYVPRVYGRTCYVYMVVHGRTWSYMLRVHCRRFVTASAHTSAVSPPYDVAITNGRSITIASSLPTSRMRRCIR